MIPSVTFRVKNENYQRACSGWKYMARWIKSLHLTEGSKSGFHRVVRHNDASKAK